MPTNTTANTANTANTASTASAASATTTNINYFLSDTVLDKTIAANAATEHEINDLVESFYKDVRDFSQRAKRYAASLVINTIARRNMTGFVLFYNRISGCGEIGKKISQDAWTGLVHACQVSGKHEQLGKSFAVKKVKTKDGTKFVEFSFKEVKSTVWTSALRWAKSHKHEILTFRLPKPDKKPMTWLDRACSIASTWSDARAKSVTGSESSVQAEQLERLDRQLDKLSKEVKEQVLAALTTLSSIELPE